MILLWVTLLLLHQGYGLVPVITAHLGETTTLTCTLPDIKDRRNKLFWYRQTAVDTLEVVVKLMSFIDPEYGAGYSDSRVKAVLTDKVSNLTILKAAQEDEGMYHCGFSDWNQNVWQGTYLLIKGNTEGTSNYRVVQKKMESDSDGPDNYVTLQCSILSDFENKTCSEDLSVFWFRSEKSHPDVIYTDGNRINRCQKKIDDKTGLVYNFSRKISSSDFGTYYCAVATCGEILFGNGTHMDIKESSFWSQNARKVIILLFAALAMNLVVIALLIYFSLKNKCIHCKADSELQKNISRQKTQERCQDGWIYSAAIFTTINSDWTGLKKEAEKERIYATVKAFGLN